MYNVSARGVARRAYHWAAARKLTDRDRLARHWVHELDGDHTYRLDYPLGSDSVVIDVGGYKGQFASDVYARFCCNVHVYEPVRQFADAVSERFASNERIVVHAYGLAATDRRESIEIRGDQTSAAAPSSTGEEIELRSAVTELGGFAQIDLLKLNIEGLEFEVLEDLLDHGLLDRVRFAQIQFHDFAPNAVARREAIRARLRTTHDLSWDFPFVWESWQRRAA